MFHGLSPRQFVEEIDRQVNLANVLNKEKEKAEKKKSKMFNASYLNSGRESNLSAISSSMSHYPGGGIFGHHRARLED